MPDKGKAKETPTRPDSAPPTTPRLPSPPASPRAPSPPTPALPASSSRPASNAQGNQANTPPSPANPLQGALRGSQPQTPVSAGTNPTPQDKNASLRRAFLSEQMANYFLSVYGRNPGLTTRVHHIGTAFDAVTSARVTYLELVNKTKADIVALARSLPGDTTPVSILKKLQKIAPEGS